MLQLCHRSAEVSSNNSIESQPVDLAVALTHELIHFTFFLSLAHGTSPYTLVSPMVALCLAHDRPQ